MNAIFKIWIVLVCVACGVLGVCFLKKGLQIKTWPIAKGKIIHSELEVVYNPKPSDKANIKYSYQVDGVAYESNSVRPGGTVVSKWPGQVEKVLKMFPVESTVDVNYNPQKHAESYLMTGLDFRGFGLILLPVIYCGIYIVMLWRRRRISHL